jgi:hypothetical protein
MKKIAVEPKEHYRRISSLLLRKWREDDGYSPRTNTMLCPPWKIALILRSLLVDITSLSIIEAESLISTYENKYRDSNFSNDQDAAKVAIDKLKNPEILASLTRYADALMGLGTKDESIDKITNLYSVDTDYGFPNWGS